MLSSIAILPLWASAMLLGNTALTQDIILSPPTITPESHVRISISSSKKGPLEVFRSTDLVNWHSLGRVTFRENTTHAELTDLRILTTAPASYYLAQPLGDLANSQPRDLKYFPPDTLLEWVAKGLYGPHLKIMDEPSLYLLVANPIELTDVTQPRDPIVSTSENSPLPFSVSNTIDNEPTKYLNFDILGSGFTVTPSLGNSIVSTLRIRAANDASDRDPASFILEGSLDGTNFVEIESGDLPVFPTRFHWNAVSFENDQAFAHYRLTFPTVRNSEFAGAMQIAEVELIGTAGVLLEVPKPAAHDGVEIYRFTYQVNRSLNTVRYERTPDQITKITKQLLTHWPSNESELLEDSVEPLPLESWIELQQDMAPESFWNLPSTDEFDGGDGFRLMVEGVKDGRYHVVDRFTAIDKMDKRGLRRFVEVFQKYNASFQFVIPD